MKEKYIERSIRLADQSAMRVIAMYSAFPDIDDQLARSVSAVENSRALLARLKFIGPGGTDLNGSGYHAEKTPGKPHAVTEIR